MLRQAQHKAQSRLRDAAITRTLLIQIHVDRNAGAAKYR
jgi:hypothetical protein